MATDRDSLPYEPRWGPPSGAVASDRAHRVDTVDLDIIGGCMPCDSCGEMWEGEMDVLTFADHGWTCDNCSDA